MTHHTPSANTTDLPTGYRMTELGPLPEEWRVVRLGEVLEEIVERVSNSNDPTAQNLPVLSLTKNEGLILQAERFNKRIATEDVSNYKIVRRGQIVYNPYVIWEGAIHILRKYEAGLVSPVYPVLKAKETVADPYYLDAWLRTPLAIAAYNRFAAGAVNRRRAIRKRDFWEIELPLPPLPEQRAIAHVLRTVQDAREATGRVIAALRDLKRSLMRHLFTYGPVPLGATGQSPLQQTDIGPIPAHWRVVRLGEVANTTSGGTPKRDAQEFYGGNIPWLKSGELDDSEVHSADEYITEEGLRRSNAKIFPPGTLLIAMYGATAGKVGILRIAAATNQAICAIFPKIPGVWIENFLFYALIHLRNGLLAQRYGGAQPNLSQRTIRNLYIPLPPLDEQRQIARILQTVDRKIEAEEAREEALDALFRSLLHHLMTAKIRLPADFIAQFANRDTT